MNMLWTAPSSSSSALDPRARYALPFPHSHLPCSKRVSSPPEAAQRAAGRVP
jgi:hypothetical protein